MSNKNAGGFSLIETMIALVIMTVGIFAALSALSFSLFSIQESEKKTIAKENVRSTLETIFSIRDLALFDGDNPTSLYNWDTLAVNNGGNNGIFVSGWTPIREDPGADGLIGTADDACAGSGSCVVNGYTNNSPLLDQFERSIQVTDISQNGNVRKKYITVSVRYAIKGMQRVVSESSIMANIPVQ